MTGAIILGYIGTAAIFAYLAIKLDESHTGFKLLNILAAYSTLIFSALVTIQYTAAEYSTDTALYNTVNSIGTNYMYLLMFILGYFVVYTLYNIFEDMVKL